ncbi:MAG TPA: DNA primase [Clostridia bacterium]
MSNYYTEDIIEEVRVNNDIVEVISEYVRLEKKGKDYFGLCPFHKEKTPSFCVVPGKQLYYCFGCGKGGNVFHFIMNSENIDFYETVKLLAERARIQLPDGNGEEQEKLKLKQEIIKLNTEAARFYFECLGSSKGEKARQYLSKRNISEKVARRFGIGYSPDEWNTLYKHLKSKGFGDDLLEISGVVQKKNGSWFDRFHGRVIFPIFDVRGKAVGFGGRVTDDSLPKYVNSPETPVYSKGKNLYALNLAKSSGQKKLVVVEGYMDVISLHQCGIVNSVASLGTALTESQGRILKKYAEEIIISYDADTAGQAATMRGLDLLRDLGSSVRVLLIPDGKDPDEFIKRNGPAAMRDLIEKSVSLVDYKASIIKKQVNIESIEGKVEFLNKITDILLKIDNNIEREIYLKKFSKEFSISEESIMSEIIKRTKPRTQLKISSLKKNEGSLRDGQTDAAHDKAVSKDESILLAVLCTDNSVFPAVKDKLSPEDFLNENSRKAAKIVFERLESKKGIVVAELFNIFDEPHANEFAAVIKDGFGDTKKTVLDVMSRIEKHKLEHRKKEILEILKGQSEIIEGDVEKLKLELKAILLKMKKN